jgi:flagellar basal-body rod modification protein FlgD
MALVAAVENGKVVESTSQSSLSNSSKSASKNTVDKDSFLQLLVAQMQYQDPLEPTSNTEYIAQYAQFSQVEALDNMSTNMDMIRASSLVGQEVYIKTTSSSGDTNYVQGKVDYVVYENGKPYLSINESLYSMDDLDTVVDSEYKVAYDAAYDLTAALKKLPVVANITIAENGKTIDGLEETYNNMSDYGKSFVASDTLETLNTYIDKLAELRLLAVTDEDSEAGS